METLKQDLVDCIRMLESSDIIDYNGHASIKLDDNRLLINIGSCQRSCLTTADICEIDFEGNVKAIVHAHPKWSTFLTMTGHDYQPVYAQGTLVYPLPLLDSPNSINNPVMAGRLADTLGDRPAALMKAHGAVTVGQTIQDAFVLANYLEENSYRQYMAMQIGTPYAFTAEEIEKCREKLWNPALFDRTWNHFKSKLSPIKL